MWDPDQCSVCKDLMHTAFRGSDVPVDARTWGQKVIRHWMRGFAKNKKPGEPYLISEELRQLVAASASPCIVAGYKQVPVVQLPVVPLASAVGDLDLHREPMDVRDPSGVPSPSDSTEEELLEEPNRSPVRNPPAQPRGDKGKSRGKTTPVPSTSDPMMAIMMKLSSLEESFTRQIAEVRAGGSGPSKTPDASSLPECTLSNPWRFAKYMPKVEGHLVIGEGLGTKPISDLEFYPSLDAYPNCWVRLSDEASIRDDTIPKETILFDFGKLQSFVVKEAKAASFSNTGITAFGRKQATFLAPDDMIFPFASKSADVVAKACVQDKALPALEECKAPSLLLPNDSEFWVGVHETFEVGKLPNNIASTQFDERLPLIPDDLLKAEFHAKERLSRSLAQQTLIETMIGNYENAECFKVLAKNNLAIFHQDLFDFMVARRACRKHVLANAKVRHEPKRLIDSSIWGKHLFPEAIVSEILDKAAQENRSLLEKWDLTNKRKSHPNYGPQAKRSRPRPQKSGPQRTGVPRQQVMQPQQVVALPQQQYVVTSPAFQPQYEQRTTTFLAAPAFRGQGKGFKRGGRSAGRGKSNRGQRGGRGSGHQNQ